MPSRHNALLFRVVRRGGDVVLRAERPPPARPEAPQPPPPPSSPARGRASAMGEREIRLRSVRWVL